MTPRRRNREAGPMPGLPGPTGDPTAAPGGDPVAILRRVKAYVRFDRRDALLLAAFYPHVEPHVAGIVEDFYARIKADPGAARVITGGRPQIERLKETLRAWLVRLLKGPHDAEFARLQSQIGRRHVQVGLDQFYMVSGIYVFREHLNRIHFQTYRRTTPRSAAIQQAFVKALDIVLALMLETYREDSLRKLLQLEQNAKVRRLAALGEVAASLAHEIRNPLAGISGAIQILSVEMGPASPRADVIREILRGVRRLDEKVNDLLIYARPLSPRREPVPPRRFLETTMRLLAEDPRLKEVRLRLRASPGLPPFPLDPGHVQQVLVNLILNAAAAMNGAGTIRLEARPLDGGGLEIAVQDSGPGVPPHLREEIFRPFFTTHPEGTGLGLSISRKIVESYGGTLQLERARKGGARFICSFPPQPDLPSLDPSGGSNPAP